MEYDLIELILSKDEFGFTFNITDNAVHFFANNELKNSKGYGLILIESIMEVKRYKKNNRGNILILKKKFSDMNES